MSKIQFCTISLYWDILASVKAFFTQLWGFWLVTMVMGYHFEFFMTYLKLSKCILSIWTQVVDLRALSKLGGLFIIYFCYLFSDPFFSTDLRLNYVWMSINTITEKTQKTFWYYLTSLIMNSTKIVFTGSIITLDM